MVSVANSLVRGLRLVLLMAFFVLPSMSLLVPLSMPLSAGVSDARAGTGVRDAGNIYRCTGPQGVEYADAPCGANPEILQLPELPRSRIPTRDTPPPIPGTPPIEADQPPVSRKGATSPCRDFLSTELRTHLIREEVVQGMTRPQVREAWGAPVDTFAGPVEIWTYDNHYYGHLLSLTRVYFEDGCVTAVETGKP